jgi:DNA mismatch endonuclease, patch repair protein
MKKPYLRDGRSPIPRSPFTSKVMRANKGTKTGPELLVRRALRKKGIKGCRFNLKTVPGRPDICIPGKMIAVFVHGCFWHKCPKCAFPLPKSNLTFWKEKFARNKVRDLKKIRELKKLGWKTFVIWECELTQKLSSHVQKIANAK